MVLIVLRGLNGQNNEGDRSLIKGLRTEKMGGQTPVAVFGWGQGGTGTQILPRPPKFLIGSVVHCFY